MFWPSQSQPQYSRLAFNCILFIQGVFALAAGGAPNWIALTSLVAVLSTGFSGTLPVDAAIFLGGWVLSFDFEHETEIFYEEFIPQTHQYLLSRLTVWWALGQLLASLVGFEL